MRTAISLPDPLFVAAEQFAKEKGLSRSELYAQALHSFLESHRARAMTDALNLLYADEPSSLDCALMQAQIQALANDPW